METYAQVFVETMEIHNIYKTDENGWSAYQAETNPPDLFAHVLLTPEQLAVYDRHLYAFRDADGTVKVAIDQAKEDAMKQAFVDGLWSGLRTERDELLAKSDYTQVADAPFTSEQKAAWAEYRQALRDLPSNVTDIENVTWPSAPA